MKRILASVIVTAGLALGTQAPASTRDFSGGVDPTGTVSFKLRASHGKLRVKRFAFSGIPIDCDSGSSTTRGVLDFARVHKRRFQALGIGKPGGSLEGSRLRVHGKLTDRHRHATGTIRVFGPAPIENGTGTNCHTGTRPWSAARG